MLNARRVLFDLVWVFSTCLNGQTLMEGSFPGVRPRLLTGDAAILESREPHRALLCEVAPVKPELGLDLAFHTGYDVSVPLRALNGGPGKLTVIFRVTSEEYPQRPEYFRQDWSIPTLEKHSKGSASLHGTIVTGEGAYRVDWLMRNQTGQFCSASWRFSSRRTGKNRLVSLGLVPGVVKAAPPLFAEEGPVERNPDHPLRVTLLVHVAPQSVSSAVLPSDETQALLSILRSVAREPRIGSYTVTAFSIDQAEILYRCNPAPQIDFPTLGNAIRQLKLGTVTLQQLQQEGARAQFLSELLTEEAVKSNSDALVFVGPDRDGNKTMRLALKHLEAPSRPVFYLKYSANSRTESWGGAIEGLIKHWKGSQYMIETPRDLALAWSDIMSRIAKTQNNQGLPTPITGLTQPPLQNLDPLTYQRHP